MPPRYRQLKPRPGQSGERVAEHQRGRIHAAMVDLVDEGGYDALTVTAIVQVAGVSKHTFYENFRDKQDCLLATYEMIVRHTARKILRARDGHTGWEARLRAGFLALLEEVADKPKAARLILLSEPDTDTLALQSRLRADGLFEALLADSLADIRDGVAVPPALLKAKVAGIRAVARARLLVGKESELPGAADELMEWALSLRSDVAAEVCTRHSAGAPTGASTRARAVGGSLVGSRDQLLGDERTMILSAAAQLATEHARSDLTVTRIRTAAGVSRRRFEEHFTSATDCLLVLLELLAGRVLGEARTEYVSAEAWPVGVHRGMVRACDELAKDPRLARLAFLELLVPGSKTVLWRTSFISSLGSLLTGAAPADERPTKMAAEASAAAALTLMQHYAATGQVRQLRLIAGTLSYLLLAPAIGADAARAVILGADKSSGYKGRTSARIGDQERMRATP